MSLDDLNKEIYNQNSRIIPTRTHEQSEYDPDAAVTKSPSPFDEEQKWNEQQKGLSPKQKKILWISLGVFLVIAIAVAGFFGYRWWQKNAFHQDRVSVSFEGPNSADSMQVTKYIVHYKNDNRVTLENAELQLTYSGNFQPTDNVNLKYLSPGSSKIFIGDIAAGSEGTAEIKGIFYAPKDSPIYLYASLTFTPSNGVGQLSMENQIGVNITAAPVVLEVTAPQQAVDGNSIEYVIDYKNLDTRRMSGAQIRVDFPQGFELNNAQPMPSEKDAYWYIGNLEADQGGQIKIRGQLNGNDGDEKIVIVSLGQADSNGKFVVFNNQEMNTRIVSPILVIRQSLEGKKDGIVNVGEVLKYKITYENTGTVGLRDAIIYAQVKGKILDFSKISIDKGSYDSAKGIITWKASDVPELASIEPKKTGEVNFSIAIKEVIPIESKLDKNFIISSNAKIDSPDIPVPAGSEKIIGSNDLELKLASKVIFDTRGYYADAKIMNSGPLPMESGRETTFTIHWYITNVSNDIADAKIVSSLPSGVRWVGQISPISDKILYNARTNQIIWEAGNINAGTGVVDAPREISFQVGVTPQVNQIGQSLVLVNKSDFAAKDIFTGQDITLSGAAKDSQLYEDPNVGNLNGKVAK